MADGIVGIGHDRQSKDARFQNDLCCDVLVFHASE